MKESRTVYECDVCKRQAWFAYSSASVGILPLCNITSKCAGTMRKVLTSKDVNNTPLITPEVPGVTDWKKRKVLYTQQQVLAQSTWKVKHNLGGIPTVFAYDANNNPINDDLFEVIPQDQNNLTVSFLDKGIRIGTCQCILNNSRVTPEVPTTQVSLSAVSTTLGRVTVAVFNNEPVVIVFVNSNGQLVPITYTLQEGSTEFSPWKGWDKAYIQNNTYSLYSFNITQAPEAANFFAVGLIEEGAKMYVDNVSHPELLFLLSKPPHSSADIIEDKYLDSKDISASNMQLNYFSGMCNIDSLYVKSTFPKIYKV